MQVAFEGVWAEQEFLLLCEQIGEDPALGISFDTFHELVNDEDGPCFADDEQPHEAA